MGGCGISKDGRHLLDQTRILPCDDPARVAQAHCQVRGFYNDDAVRLVQIVLNLAA